jgi:hypothetical protein
MPISVWRDAAIRSNPVADTSRTGTDLSTRAWVELLLLSAIWGGIFFSVAIAQREIGPITVVLHRVGWAAVLLWLVVAARGLWGHSW